MVQVTYHPKFKKQYKTLRFAQRERFAQALALFIAEPYHPTLYNHPLTGDWRGQRSIAFGGDWRAHYRVIDEKTVVFTVIGTHSQLYK